MTSRKILNTEEYETLMTRAFITGMIAGRNASPNEWATFSDPNRMVAFATENLKIAQLVANKDRGGP